MIAFYRYYELKKDDYIYKDPHNKNKQFVERLECPTFNVFARIEAGFE